MLIRKGSISRIIDEKEKDIYFAKGFEAVAPKEKSGKKDGGK